MLLSWNFPYVAYWVVDFLGDACLICVTVPRTEDFTLSRLQRVYLILFVICMVFGVEVQSILTVRSNFLIFLM
jgi:hypothetical protein